MQILVAAATELEIAPFVKANPSADILITGAGAAAAMYHLTKRIQLIDYDLVIQAGIAGSFSKDLPPGTVVTVFRDCFADEGVNTKDGFETLFDLRLADPDHMPYKNGWLVNENEILKTSDIRQVSGITVNMITDDPVHIKMLSDKYNADVESMEGATLHYVCLMEEVPFLQLRCISNFIGERDKRKWKMEEAVDRLHKELQCLYEKLLHAV